MDRPIVRLIYYLADSIGANTESESNLWLILCPNVPWYFSIGSYSGGKSKTISQWWNSNLEILQLLNKDNLSIHPKFYKHLKKGAHQSHMGRLKKGVVSGGLVCTSSKIETLKKIGI